jgi:hypothetical protein
MSEMAGKNGSIDSRALGHFIRKHESRREGGLRFERAGTSHNVVRWRVAEDEPPGSMKSLG